MRRLLLGAVLVAACAGCGERERAGTAPARSTTTAPTAPRTTTTTTTTTTTARRAPARKAHRRKATRTARRFVGEPDVRVSRSGDHVRVVARVDLPLPQGAYGVEGGFGIRGMHADVPGIDGSRGVRRCYEEDLFAAGRRLRPGDPVTVRLHVGLRPTRVLTARTRVAGELSLNDVRQRRILRRLGCPRLPPETQCDGVGQLSVIVRGGATCATGRRVMRKVSRWAEAGGCEEDLCASQHRMNAGFRCTVAQVGEADWSITCRRGGAVVRGGLSY